MFGGNPAVGTVTLSGPASGGVIISLTTNNPSAISLPANVSVAPGARTATFSIKANHVTADTVAAVNGAYQGTTRSGTVTVRKETATVTVTKAQLTVSKSQLNVEATSTDRVGSLQVFNAGTGTLVGNLPSVGGGRFVGQFTVHGPLTSVGVQSSVGGLAISSVQQK